jgi:hypothetical protein
VRTARNPAHEPQFRSDLYGTDAGEAIRAAFMRWCNRHVTRVRRTYVEFAR